jgi:signal transduction histidine kinase
MPSLPEFMDEHRHDLLEASVRVLRRHHPKHHSEEELVSTLPAYLDELIHALRAGEAPQEHRETEQARHAAQMGRQRLARGFEIGSIAHLFGAISEALGEIGKQANVEFAAGDYQAFNRCMDASIARAIESFHDGARETAEHEAARFVGFLAHELRNELSTARMSYDSVLSGHVGLQSKTGAILGRSLQRMEALIAQTLAAVQLESGQPTELASLALYDVLEPMLAAAFPPRQITVRLEVDRSLRVMADERLLTSAFGNLVQNALKFTKSGGRIVVRARREAGHALVEVEDECGGLPPGKQEELFVPFTQRGANRRGLGLGLAITSRAVAAHGGEINVHNLPGKGCIFEVRLPIDPTVQA